MDLNTRLPSFSSSANRVSTVSLVFFRLPHRLYNVACHENRELRHDLFVVVVLGLCCLLCFCCHMRKGLDTLLTVGLLS